MTRGFTDPGLGALEGLAPELRAWRRRRLWEAGPTTCAVAHSRLAVRQILEHRDPFLFVDDIVEVDLQVRGLRGRRHISRDDPVFIGHFPGQPTYPGVLQLETMAQMGLCLMHFCATASPEIAPDAVPRPVRALKIHYAVFQAEVSPGDDLDVLAKLLASDEYTAVCAGQILKGAVVCALAVTEAYLLGD
jgi:3-hydroxyacyl-[acyl-carrier-protein] dehydratase